MPPRWNENRLTAKLGIDYPVIQGPLGGLSSQKLTAAVSNFGGLGSFGAHGLTPEAIKEVIAEIRSLTSKPFAMNLWVSMEDEGARTSDENAFNRSLAALATHIAALGAPRPEYNPHSWMRFEHQVRVLLDAKVPVFSFIRSEEHTSELQSHSDLVCRLLLEKKKKTKIKKPTQQNSRCVIIKRATRP